VHATIVWDKPAVPIPCPGGGHMIVTKAVRAGGCMRAFGLAVVAATITTAMAAAADGRFERSLKMLAPAERLEQLCDYTAMTRIREQNKDYRPDRAVANAMAEPVATGDALEVTGGAFRSRKKWYALSYRCAATPDHLTIVAFRFTVGAEIPEDKWASFGLSE
jgi:Domain of Unknown Function (DUF930)